MFTKVYKDKNCKSKITNNKHNSVVKTPVGYRDYVSEPLGFRVDGIRDGLVVKQEYAKNTYEATEIEDRFRSEGLTPETFWTCVDTVD